MNAAATPRLRRWDVALLVGLCLATLVYGVGNLSLRPAARDGYQNLKMGVWLAQQPSRVGYIREPFLPAVIATVILVQRSLGYEPVPPSCVVSEERAETLQCRSAYAPYKVLNVVFVLVAGVGVFFLCRWHAGARWLPHVAFLLVTQSLFGIGNLDHFYTEVPAAALIVAVSCLSVLTLVRRHVLHAALLGLTLAALVLTKIAFLYFWPFFVAGLVVADLLQGTFGRRTALLVGGFLIAYFLPTGSWMARNFVLHDDFSVVNMDHWRAKRVLLIREAYNTMRNDEFAAGFWYYTPYKPDLGVPERSYERLDTRNANGFREQGFRMSVAPEREMLWARVFAEPWRHLKISMLMAYRGLFIHDRLGFAVPSGIWPLRARSLPRELTLPAFNTQGAHNWNREQVYVAWFRERGTVNGYDEAELKEFLNLETVAELSDATLYRVPLPGDLVKRTQLAPRKPSPFGAAFRLKPSHPITPSDFAADATKSDELLNRSPFQAKPKVTGDCEDWATEQFFRSATVEEVVACLNAGAHPNARNDAGGTALHLAAQFNPSGEVIRALIDAGAEPNAPNDKGLTPLNLADQGNSMAAIEALLDAGAYPDMRPHLYLAARLRESSPDSLVLKDFLEDWAQKLQHLQEWPPDTLMLSNRAGSLPSPMVAMPRFADVWGLDSWPRWEWYFDPLLRTLVGLVGFLALLVVPLWFWFGRRRIEVVFVVLPALYLHAVYAVASHFIPRYAQPEVPLQIWATALVVYLTASFARRLVGTLGRSRVSKT